MAVKYFSSYKKQLFQGMLLKENKFIISKGIIYMMPSSF